MTAPRLTPREAELLAAYASGCEPFQLPELMHLSLNTTRTHAANLYRKLGAHNRKAAVAAGRRLGLLPLDEQQVDWCLACRRPVIGAHEHTTVAAIVRVFAVPEAVQ